jgi:hypothetical protein
MFNSKKMGWTQHLARLEEKANVFKIFVGKPEGRQYLRYLGIDGEDIIKLHT